MKKLFLFFPVAMLTMLYATANPYQETPFGKRPEKQKTIKQEHDPVIRNLSYYTEHQQKNDRLKTRANETEKKEKDLFSFSTKDFSGLSDFTKAKSMRDEITQYVMDSIYSDDPYGNKIWKIELIYDERYWPIRQKNMLWEAFSFSYELAEDWNYEWNDDGYLTAQWTIVRDDLFGDWGWKDIYHYNEDNLCTAYVTIDYANNTWSYADSITFQYDERGNPIELHGYSHDGTSWYENLREVAEYDDPYDRQTYYEGYYLDPWGSGEWLGESKNITEWLDNPVERMTYRVNFDWNNGEWYPRLKTTQEWNEHLKCTLQEMLFWNSTSQDWTGMFSGHAIMTYLEDGRPDNECWWNLTGGTFVRGYEFDFEWDTYPATGEAQMVEKGYMYNAAGTSKTQDAEIIARYPTYYPAAYAYDMELYNYYKSSLISGSTYEYQEEVEREFDENGRVIFDAYYYFNDENWGYTTTRHGFIAGAFKYDAAGNTLLEAWEYGALLWGYGYGDPETWVHYSKFDYEYDDFGNRLRKYRYTYPDGITAIPDWGEGVDYNHDIPGYLLLTFPEHYDDPFMMTYLYKFDGNGTDFDASVMTFYYSELISEGYTVTVSANPPEGGTVTGEGIFNAGDQAIVTATAKAGYNFVNWTEDGVVVHTEAEYSFEVESNRDLVANFEAIEKHTITVSANPQECSASGGGTFEIETEITVTAMPCENYEFVNWTEGGEVVSTDVNYTFTVESDRDLVANFQYLGIDDVDVTNMQAYYDQGTIYFKNILPNTWVQVIDVTGKIVKENIISEERMPFAEKGIYIIRLVNNNVMQMQKIVAY